MASSKARFPHSLNFWLFEFGKSLENVFGVGEECIFGGGVLWSWTGESIFVSRDRGRVGKSNSLCSWPFLHSPVTCCSARMKVEKKERERIISVQISKKMGLGPGEKTGVGGQHVWPSVDSNDSLWHLVIYVYSKRTIVTILKEKIKKVAVLWD